MHIPPTLPLHATPRSKALMNSSDGSRERMIGSENVKTNVVEATLERKAAMK